MANVIKHKRGSGSDPSASDLILGELAIRTDTGKLFTKMDSGAIAEIAGGGSDIAINTLSSSSGTGGGSATFNGSAYRFTLSQPPNVSAAQLLVSINGVIQKPVAGTGQPSEGFSVDGTDIILGDAPAAGSDFFILTFKSLGVSEPADNSVTSAKIVDGAIVNADINASAAIAGTKISPDFGSQNIITTGTITSNDITISDQQPRINFTDTNGNPDYLIQVDGGHFLIHDATNGADKIKIQSDGHIDITPNTDFGAGIDVTGAITATDNITITSSHPKLLLTDDTNPDFSVHVNASAFHIRNETDTRNDFRITSDGTNELYHGGNLKLKTVSGGIDVTGDITANGSLNMGTELNMTEGVAATRSIDAFVGNAGTFRIRGTNSGDSSGHQVLAEFRRNAGVHLNHSGSTKIETTSDGVEVTGSVVSENLSGRNMIINGDCRIAQRGTSGTFSSSGTSYPSIDRIKIARNGVTGTIAQVGDAPAGKGFHFSAKMTTTSAVSSIAAGNIIRFDYHIERQDCVRLGYGDASAKTSVLSFYVKSSLTGSFGVAFNRNSRIQSHNITYSTANTWQFVEVVVPGDTSTAINGGMTDIGMSILITISAGGNSTDGGAVNTWVGFHNSYTGGGATMQHLTNNGSTFQITGLQYEIGSKATPFEHKLIGEELLRCQRYYQEIVVVDGNSGAGILRASSSNNFQQLAGTPQVVKMRAAATGAVVSSNSTITCRRLNGSSSDISATLSFAGGSATHARVSFRFTGDTAGQFVNTEPYACWEEQRGGIVVSQNAEL